MRGAKRASTSRRVGPRAARVCGGANVRPSPRVRCLGTSSSDGGDASSSSSPAAAGAAPAGSSKESETVATSKSKSTIDALSALLGDDTADEEQKREEEADRLRAEKAALLETEKAKKEERLKAFRSASVSTLRLQQLQRVFIDLPIVPKRLQGIFLNNNNNSKNDDAAAADAASSAAAATVADLPDTEWFDLALPSDAGGVGDKKTAADDDAAAAAAARRASLFGEDITPEFIEYDGERLPGEFSIPVMPYPFVCHPGSQVRLNLFEPRWLTLFAKLMVEKPKENQKTDDSKATAGGGGGGGGDESAAAAPSLPLVLLGARGENRIDLIRNKMVQAYEAGDDEAYDIVPGAGRMDETPFVGRATCVNPRSNRVEPDITIPIPDLPVVLPYHEYACACFSSRAVQHSYCECF